MVSFRGLWVLLSFISPKITLYSLIKSYTVPMGRPDIIISYIRLSCEISSKIHVLNAFNKLFLYLHIYSIT